MTVQMILCALAGIVRKPKCNLESEESRCRPQLPTHDKFCKFMGILMRYAQEDMLPSLERNIEVLSPFPQLCHGLSLVWIIANILQCVAVSLDCMVYFDSSGTATERAIQIWPVRP